MMSHLTLTEEDLQKSAALSENILNSSTSPVEMSSSATPEHDDDENMADDTNQYDSADDGEVSDEGEFREALEDPQSDQDMDGHNQEHEDDTDGHSDQDSQQDSDASSDDADDTEGVGAVKLKPGESEDDDEDDMHDDMSNDSESHSGDESSSAEEWEADEHMSDEEEEGSLASNVCIYCRKDDENDPSGETEEFLTCIACSDNAHRQCATESGSRDRNLDASSWKCNECLALAEATANNTTFMDASQISTREHTLSAEPRFIIGPFSQSGEGPSENSRSLRKRTMTAADEDEAALYLRKRLRQGSALSKLSQDENGEEPEQPSSARSLRVKRQKLVAVLKKGPKSILVRMKVKPTALRLILEQPPAGLSRGRRGGARGAAYGNSAADLEPPAAPFTYISQPFYSFFDRETDQAKGKPYGGVLNDDEADTTKTLPIDEDRKRFMEAKAVAEEEWRSRILKMQAEMPLPPKKPKKSKGPGSQIECIDFGGWEIDTWYAAPYPEEYSRNRVLYICEFCLKYMNSDYVAWRHKLKCPAKHPPGDEIYRHESISVFEVDGRKHPVYCQNLCLLAKLFLGSKTLYYDVEPFLFYVLCEYDELGYHFVGYFSKEKRESSQNNVSCILTLPIHQRKGYGNLLIDFSYLLTRVEHKTGSPEKPLSDMGLVSYRNYWRLILSKYLLKHIGSDSNTSGLSIRQISEDTGLTADDVVSGLEGLRCLVRDPETQLYAFRVDIDYCRNYIAKWEAKKYVKLEPTALTWTPYVMGRGANNNYDLAPSLSHLGDEEDQDRRDDKMHIDSELKIGDKTLSNTAEVFAKNGFASQTGINGRWTDSEFIIPTTESRAASMMGDSHPADVDDDPMKWIKAYENIPPIRFQVFPPMVGGRRLEASRSSVISAPSVSMPRLSNPSSIVPPRKRSSGTIKKKPIGRPKASSSSRKRKGGTGRGPGRWPKGTKKSDYGNAASGPGLPPGWRKSEPTKSMDQGQESIEDLVVSDLPAASIEGAA